MKVVEIKVIYESDDIDRATKEISDIFYDFGVTGLKIEEPMKHKNPLDFYKNEKDFLIVDHSVSSYFPLNIYDKKKKKVILERFEEVFSDREDIVYTIDFYEYDEEDYQNSWKKYLFTEKVSERFVVKPTWREYEPKDDELIIELDPGRAFGTGSHPTTSLCLKLMEENIKEGDSVIDVGTGSGILMIAADRLGASEVYGTDIDELAVESAKENLELNGISEERAKVYLGNLVSVVILLNDISKVVKKDGLVIFSGIIDEKCELLKREVEALGMEILEVKADKEWRAMLIKAN